jgi:hypothetical protein
MVKERHCFSIALYLIIAVMGAYTFSVSENFHFFENNGKLASSAVFSHPVGHAVDCLAEEQISITKAGRHSSFLFRSGCPHENLLVGIQNPWAYNAGSLLQTTDKYHVPVPKNFILLKLRI